MRRILAIDLGKRRTGVSYTDTETLVPVSLETLHHINKEEQKEQLLHLCKSKNVTDLVIGLPLLLSGSAGEQSAYVQSTIESIGFPSSVFIHFVDERYSTSRDSTIDNDAAAAIDLLHVFLSQEKFGK